MRFIFLWLVLFSLIALVNSGCSGSGISMDPVNPDNSVQENGTRDIEYLPDEWCGDETITELIAGQFTDVGEVIVTNDGQYLYIEFVVEAPWVLLETHVAVSETLDGIPQTKKGNPKVGNFDYSIDSFIDLSLFGECGIKLFIAAHAVVQKLGKDGEIIQEETAWGQGYQFNDGRSWAMYFRHTIQCCCEDLNLPPDLPDSLIDFKVGFGTETYIKHTLWNVPTGYYVTDGVYNGWCSDKDNLIYVNRNYKCYLYNSYAPETWPNDVRFAIPWDKINYLMNNRDGFNNDDVQNAIWHYSNGMLVGGGAAILVADADANGAGFSPGLDDYIAIIVYVPGPPDVQVTIIQIETECE
ncbi:hypothetical protein KKB99_04915 [bacterium]|nr:hypothetical protein [bacterium]MBU1025338.1 hypothetical protein [bacterium]